MINIGDAWYGDITDQTLGIGVSDPEATLHLKAGTATANTAPIRFNPGTVLTTAEAGAIEYDGKAFYSSVYLSGTDVGTRGVSPSVNFTCNTADVSMTSGTGSQSVFDASRDALTVLANTTYYFEAQYVITGMGGTAKGIKTLFGVGGGTTISSINYSVLSWGSAGSIESDQRTINVNVATATPTVHPNMFSESVLQLKGIIRIGSSGGTVTPQIQFSAAPGGTIKGATNSYFLIYAIGDDAVSSVGAWN